MTLHRSALPTALVGVLCLLLTCTGGPALADTITTTTPASIAVATTPAAPLLDVGFLATTSAGTDKTLYISSTRNCSTPLSSVCTLGRAQAGVNYNATTCIFNVTGTSLAVNATTTTAIPSIYWCSSASGTTAFATLQMSKVVISPTYAYLNTDSTITFNAATPVGTTVGLYTTSSCGTLLTGTSTTTLTSSRTMQINIGTRGITYLCATIPTVYTSASVLATRAVIYGVSAYDIYTTSGIRHRSITISADSTFLYVSFSTDPQCLKLAQPYTDVSQGGTTLTIAVPRGTYYFCAVKSAGVGSIGAFVPAQSTFDVLEYGVQPQTLYAGQPTTMRFAMDAVDAAASLQAALFTTPGCSASSGTQVTSWAATMAWTLTSTGTFYACVRTDASASAVGYVNQVVVSTMPDVALSRLPGIMGLGEVATVTRSGMDVAAGISSAIISVGISNSPTCATVHAAGNTTATGTTASFYVPENSASSVYYCVSNRLTTDQSNGDSSEATTAYYYSFGTLQLSTYGLTYPPLRTGTSLTIRLDSSVSFTTGTYMYLAPALTTTSTTSTSTTTADDSDTAIGSYTTGNGVCDTALAASSSTMAFTLSSSTTELTPVVFASAGSWLLCAREVDVLNNASVQLRTLTVYGNATIAPAGVIPGIAASLAVSSIPSTTTVALTAESTCATGMSVVTSTTSSLTGTATLALTYDSVATLLLCVGYRGEANSQDTAIQLMTAGSVVSAAAEVVPPVAVVGVATTLSFWAPGAATLDRHTALLVSEATCPSSASSSTTVVSATITATSTSATVATMSFTPTTAQAGSTYRVCVGDEGNFQSAGTVRVMAAIPAFSTDPTPLAHGLPAQVNLSTKYLDVLTADVFVVIDAADSCTADLSSITVYASGSIDAGTGVLTTFLAPATTTNVAALRFCAAQSASLVSNTLGYADAGTTTLAAFTSVTSFAQRQRTNTLVGLPMVSDGSLFLIGCDGATCAASVADETCATSSSAARYTTSSTENLTAPVGTYLLCQSVPLSAAIITNVDTVVVGSNRTVTVIEPFVLSTIADTSALRLFVPFNITITGGPSAADSGATYVVTVQPAAVACTETPTTEAQSFALTIGVRTEITLTSLTPQQLIHFCVHPSSDDGMSVLSGQLLPYMTPAALIVDTATTVTAGAPVSGARAMLSTSVACKTGSVTGGTAQWLSGGQVTFTMPGCDSTNSQLATVYYCETNAVGVYVSRGSMAVLRRSNCIGGLPASINTVSTAPGKAITEFGLTSSALTAPQLSSSADCSALVDGAVVAASGYAPAVDEAAVFYVCAQLSGDSAMTFTTTAPTLTVRNWAASPTAVLSRFNSTIGTQPAVSVSLNYPTPTSATFFSASAGCTTSLGSAAGLTASGGAATYRTVGVRGLAYVCTTNPLDATAIAVARLLSVTPPTVVHTAPAIVVGATYTATLVVDGANPLYSMVAGVDTAYAYSSYYTSTNRSVFLSSDGCVSGIPGLSPVSVNVKGEVALSTTDMATTAAAAVSLCAGTAAGTSVVLSGLPIASGEVYPTQYVSGALGVPIYIPRYPTTDFQFSASDGDCTAVTSSMPTFTTDSAGYGSVDIVMAKNSFALAAGTYTLCASTSQGGWEVVDTVTVVNAVFFDIRGTTFVVGTPATMELLDDLQVSYLYSGFSTTRACADLSTSYGSWSSISDTSVLVTATSASSSGLYLCAQSPHNASIIALPAATAKVSSLRFVDSAMTLPAAGGWDACTAYTLDTCYPPGDKTSSSTDLLAMVYGDCCDVTKVIVGQASMASGTCTLGLNYATVASYDARATFNLCVLDSADSAVCTTVAREISVSTACTPVAVRRGLSGGAIAGIVIGCVVGGLLLLALILLLVLCCCCGRKEDKSGSKEGKLVAFQALAEGDNHLVGYVLSGRHPLLYYPSGSSVGRSISPSPPYPSTSSGTPSSVEEREEEVRDNISLQEARARYNLRLLYAECRQDVDAAAKNAELDATLNGTWASDTSELRGTARPVRRSVESIIVDDDATAAGAAPELSAATAAFLEEQAVNLMEDDALSVHSACSRVPSCAIEGATPAPVSLVESFLTNEDFEEREESGSDVVDVHVAYDSATNSSAITDEAVDASGATELQWSGRAGGADGDEVPRQVLVRHFVNPRSVKHRSPSNRATSGSRQRLDPAQLEPVAFAEPPTPSRGAGRGDAFSATPPAVDESASLARSPISPSGLPDLSEGAMPTPRLRSMDSTDSEEDLLSFTTTQRFHDEARFMLEQEDGRRQRLCNWEEEERAELTTLEMQTYNAVPLARSASDAGAVPDLYDDDDAVFTTPTAATAAGAEFAGYQGNWRDREASEEEEVYRAPSRPAALPSLPPAPRPQTLQNEQHRVVRR